MASAIPGLCRNLSIMFNSAQIMRCLSFCATVLDQKRSEMCGQCGTRIYQTPSSAAHQHPNLLVNLLVKLRTRYLVSVVATVSRGCPSIAAPPFTVARMDSGSEDEQPVDVVEFGFNDDEKPDPKQPVTGRRAKAAKEMKKKMRTGTFGRWQAGIMCCVQQQHHHATAAMARQRMLCMKWFIYTWHGPPRQPVCEHT